MILFEATSSMYRVFAGVNLKANFFKAESFCEYCLKNTQNRFVIDSSCRVTFFNLVREGVILSRQLVAAQ